MTCHGTVTSEEVSKLDLWGGEFCIDGYYGATVREGGNWKGCDFLYWEVYRYEHNGMIVITLEGSAPAEPNWQMGALGGSTGAEPSTLSN